MQEEIWKDIPDYEGFYQASNLGRIRRLESKVWNGKGYRKAKGGVMKQFISQHGYYRIQLYKLGGYKTFSVHSLVAQAFLNHKPCGMKIVVDHINNIKTDNRAENLQLLAQRENATKDARQGGSKYVGVGFCKNRNKFRARTIINGKDVHIGYFDDEYEAHLAYKRKVEEHLKRGE